MNCGDCNRGLTSKGELCGRCNGTMKTVEAAQKESVIEQVKKVLKKTK